MKTVLKLRHSAGIVVLIICLVAFTDLRFSYNPDFLSDALTLSFGFNNVFDEDPSVCDACGVIGMSPVSHDLPGPVGYLRVTYEL